MSHSLIWLPSVLNGAGLKIALVEGWEDRGRGDVGDIFGVICHHTAGIRTGNMPSLKTLINGRSDLPGPLAQLGLGRDGTYYVIAAGRCNHAGKGSFRGLSNGNTNFIGIEAENTGLNSDFPWPDIQMDAYHRGVAAILNHLGRGAENCCAHKEYALPVGRKNDPLFSMNSFRSKVAELLTAGVPSRQPISLVSSTGRPTLRRGATSMPDALVKQVQQKLGVTADGNFGPKTEAAVRVFQRENGLIPDGIVGPRTWIVLDAI